MARSDTTGTPRRNAVHGLRLAGTVLVAATLLVAPIVLWATFGDGDVEHSIAVAILASLLCWAFVHRFDLGEGPPPLVAPSPLHAPVEAPVEAPAVPCPIARRSPVVKTRLARDVGCHSAEYARRRRSRP